MDELTLLVALKAVLLVLPSIAFVLLTDRVWKGRLLGPAGRARYGAVCLFLLTVAAGVTLGGAAGGVIYDQTVGSGCRELGCLAVIGWVFCGSLAGLAAGVVTGWRLRGLAGRHAVAFYLPSAASALASIAAVVLNGDMLR